MTILIINNKWDNLPHLVKCLSWYNFDIIDFRELDRDDYKNYDFVILSWWEIYEVLDYPEAYREELELIKRCDKPILWICLWMQLIWYAFWEKLFKLSRYYKELIDIEVLKNDPIFSWLPKIFSANVDHNWAFNTIDNFHILCKSHYCIKAIKHKQKEIYWVQFHPEINYDNTKSYKIIENFLKI